MRLLTVRDFAPSEEKCLEVIRKLRWGRGVVCPYCNSSSIHRFGKNPKGLQRYRCKTCTKLFTDLSKTIFERTRLKLWQWFYLIKESQTRSLHSIALDLEKPYWTIWRNAKKLKEDLLAKKLKKKLRGSIEIDETYITVGEKGSKKLSRAPRQRGGTKIKGRGGLKEGKMPILVITQRGGNGIFIVAFEGLSQELILKLLEQWVEPGSIVNTDDFLIYTHINTKYEHKIVPRYNGRRRFVEGDAHINHAENRFSFLKSWYRKFRGLGKKYLNLWINFFEFLLNLKMSVIEKTINLIQLLM
jgi:transposase-like protein